MMPDWIVRLIGGAAIVVGLAAAYISGRDEGRRREARRQRQELPTWMDHTHGGDPDDPA